MGTKMSLNGMEYEEPPTTLYSQRMERSAWLTQRHEEVASRLREALPSTKWVAIESLERSSNSRVLCRCQCGEEHSIRVKDILYGKTKSCRSCASKDRMAKVPIDQRVYASKHMNSIPRQSKYASLYSLYGQHTVDRLRRTLAGARQRCDNPANLSYPNYGGRGITFGFSGIYEATVYCLSELGPVPEGMSIDRIDNERGYEPGNLRWATPLEQARNKRQYKRTHIGRAIRRVTNIRSDLTYETVRTWLLNGVTEEEALTRGKYARTSL